MKKLESDRVQEILDDVAPKLDSVLTGGPINDFLRENKYLTPELLRRGGTCQPTSELLEKYLPSQDIRAKIHYKNIDKVRHNKIRNLGGHVLLKTHVGDGRGIDPTWQQFFSLVGLTPQAVMKNPALAKYYPENSIALIEPHSTEFADSVAYSAHELDIQEVIPVAKNETGSIGFLRNTTLEEKVELYREIWDLDSYKPFGSRGGDTNRALIQSAAILCRL